MSGPSIEPVPPPVVAHYERLARRYDHRWHAYTHTVLERLLSMLTLHGTERILDIGCGTGELERLASQRFPGLTLVGLDATPAMVEVAREKLAGRPGVSVEVGEAEALPFVDECFNVVVAANMLHHVRSVPRALTEGIRVLRPGGWFCLLDWCRDYWHCRLLHYWLRATDRTYVRMYRLHELYLQLRTRGVAVRQTRRFIAPPVYGLMCVTAVKGGA